MQQPYAAKQSKDSSDSDDKSNHNTGAHSVFAGPATDLSIVCSLPSFWPGAAI